MPPKHSSKRLLQKAKKVTPSASARQTTAKKKKLPPSIVPGQKNLWKASTKRASSSAATVSTEKQPRIITNPYAKKLKKKPIDQQWGSTKRKLDMSQRKPPPIVPAARLPTPPPLNEEWDMDNIVRFINKNPVVFGPNNIQMHELHMNTMKYERKKETVVKNFFGALASHK